MTTKDARLLEIAKRHLGLETLATQYSDSLDFHDCAVWSIRTALQEAYDSGKAEPAQPDAFKARVLFGEYACNILAESGDLEKAKSEGFLAERSFATEGERSAYLCGIDDSADWSRCKLLDDEEEPAAPTEADEGAVEALLRNGFDDTLEALRTLAEEDAKVFAAEVQKLDKPRPDFERKLRELEALVGALRTAEVLREAMED